MTDARPQPITHLAAEIRTRRLVVLMAVLVAIGVPALQALTGFGIDQAQFAADGDETLRVAGYTFSIWGVIYAALAVYGIHQVLPRTRETPALARLGWPSVLALVGIAAWILAAAFDQKWATVVIIVLSALALVVPMLRDAGMVRAARGTDRYLVLWPLGLLAGWLTIASAANILTVATAEGLIDAGAADAWALAGIVVVAVVAVFVAARTRLLAYPIPIVWGAVGVFAAERSENALVGNFALGAAILVALVAAALCFGPTDRPGTVQPA